MTDDNNPNIQNFYSDSQILFRVMYQDDPTSDKRKIAYCFIEARDENFLYIKFPDGEKKAISLKVIFSISQKSPGDSSG